MYTLSQGLLNSLVDEPCGETYGGVEKSGVVWEPMKSVSVTWDHRDVRDLAGLPCSSNHVQAGAGDISAELSQGV